MKELYFHTYVFGTISALESSKRERHGIKMRIAFFAQILVKGEKAGIAWNAYYIIQELLKFSENYYKIDYFAKDSEKEKVNEISNMLTKKAEMNPCRWFHGKIYNIISSLLPIPYNWFFRKNCNITQFFNFYIPPGVKGKKITIIHDMAYKTCPKTVKIRTKILLNLTLKKSCKRADAIVTVSEFSKREILRYINVKEEKIKVIPNGVDLKIYHNDYTSEEVERVKHKHGISGNYFLYLGTLEPRKNIERMLEAYSLFRKNTTHPFHFVLAGGKGWMYESIFDKVKDLGLEKDIVFTGYVEEKDIPVLMCGAKVFVFPSLYEGFGIPPLESMACGTPVIVSNDGALAEVVGDAGVRVNPYMISDIANAMEVLVTEDVLYQKLSKSGLERAKQFTWEKAACQFNELYHSLVQ